MPITNQDYIDAGKELECEVNVIRAVAAVESGKSGFLPTGEVTILFEPHVFWKQLQIRRIDPKVVLMRQMKYSDILYPTWGMHPYGKPSEQWDRLRKAGEINLEAASCSASYGKFQIMGYHYGKAGYSTIYEMTHFFGLDESYHLKAFIAYLKATGLHVFLAAKNWKDFARNYNGAGYRNSPDTNRDDYDYKLREKYYSLTAINN